MKKTLIAVAAAAALATSSAFAEVTFGGWLNGIIVPIANNGGEKKDFRAGHVQNWANFPRPAAFTISGVSEDEMAGFRGDIFFDNDEWLAIHTGDYAMTWLKPVDMLKLSFGKYDDSGTGLREGAGGFGIWNFLRTPITCDNGILNGDGGIFQGTGGRNGFMAEITPIEGLKAVVLIPFGTGGSDWSWSKYKKTMVNVAYTIDGIGTVKAGWWGENEVIKDGDDDYDYLGRIGASFSLTAVENLYVAVGAKFDIGDKEYTKGASMEADKYDEATKDLTEGQILRDFWTPLSTAIIALNASYNVTDELTVNLAGGVNIFKDSDFDPQFSIAGGASYRIMDGLTALADVRYTSKLKTDNVEADDSVSFLVGLTKGIGSAGSLGIGFEGLTNGGSGAGFCGIAAGADKEDKKKDSFMWCVPVVYSFSF